VTALLKTDENGNLQVPADLLPDSSPNTEYSVSRTGQSAIIEPAIVVRDFWRKLTPEQRVQEFLAWVDSHKDGPGLSDWAVSRDSIYD
jgi:hypothetical protein